ncbi:MAG: discoidin domain-containing protein [Verrucomicrobiales bacterium]|nr:discoidin domain-containing protein [Verrucomicrobiales bacterium]
MKLRYLTPLFSVAAALHTSAQEVTPVWVQHINGTVNVDPANVLPILNKPENQPVIAMPDGLLRDGRESLAIYSRLVPYDANRLLLAVSENGIDELSPDVTPEQLAKAAQFPDRSLVWLEAATGKPLGVAWSESLRPADLIDYDVTAGQTGYQANKGYAFWRPVLDENPDPTKRAIYSGYRHLILRYAPKADGTGWETTPTIAWEEPLPGLDEADGAVKPEAGIGDGLSGTASTSGEQGSWRAWRWRNTRVYGYGLDTIIAAGGGTWRIGQQPQLFKTTDGLTFTPFARVDDRGNNARRNDFALGGTSSRRVQVSSDPARPNLEVIYSGHYPGSGWQARPNRYTSNPDNPTPSDPYNNQPDVRLFKQDEAEAGNFPKFVWEAAGKDGLPLERGVDGVDRYDGNWSVALDTNPKLDYLVSISASSYDVGFYTYAWVAVHRLDGSIASGKSSYVIPVKEDDVLLDYGGSVEPDFDTTESWLEVVPDLTAPANLGKSYAYVALENGGFGVFEIKNVAAAIQTNPSGTEVLAGSEVVLTAAASGSPNTYRWTRNGVPLTDGKYVKGSKTAKLTLSQIVPSEAGDYQLQITNPLGNLTTTVATVKVGGAYIRPANGSLTEDAVATASSTAFGGPPSYAIDGNTDGNWGGNSVFHSDNEVNPWLSIDLGGVKSIGQIVYYRRTDCCGDRSDNLIVTVLNATGGVEYTYAAEGTPEDPLTLDINPPVNGKTVRVERQFEDPTKGYLNIAEVQVWSAASPSLAVGSYQGDAVVAWAGAGAIVLEEASKVEGPYTEVAGATNPFRVPTAGAQAKFYRAVRK